ncbi:MAG: hypothetical protein AABZ32_00315 [Bacteroidota bacterium]
MKSQKEKILKLIICIIIIIFNYSCEKISNTIDNTYLGFSSPETKLTHGGWELISISKDGAVIHSITVSPVCGMESMYRSTSVGFVADGEVNFSCSSISPNDTCCLGTWQLTKHNKNIEITTQYSCAKQPIPVIVINWKILYLSTKSLRVQETKADGIYEYAFRY